MFLLVRIESVFLVVPFVMPEGLGGGGALLRRIRYPSVAVLVETVRVVGHVLDHAVNPAVAAVAAAAVVGIRVPRLLLVELVHRMQGIVKFYNDFLSPLLLIQFCAKLK